MFRSFFIRLKIDLLDSEFKRHDDKLDSGDFICWIKDVTVKEFICYSLTGQPIVKSETNFQEIIPPNLNNCQVSDLLKFFYLSVLKSGNVNVPRTSLTSDSGMRS